MNFPLRKPNARLNFRCLRICCSYAILRKNKCEADHDSIFCIPGGILRHTVRFDR